MAKEKKKMQPIARLNVNFETEEERQILENIKVAALQNRVRIREYVISVFRDLVGTERAALPDKKKK